MKLILTRHGETKETKSGILQGHLPGNLTDFGIQQAQNLAYDLQNMEIDYIFSSDLDRAFDTAFEVQKFYKNLNINTSTLLRERTFGDFDGKNKNKIGFYDKNHQHIFENPPNGETMEEVYNRAKTFLDNLFEKYFENTILIVAHDDILKALIAVIKGKSSKNIKEIESIKKCDYKILNIEINGDYEIIK